MIIYLPCKLGESFIERKFAGWENKKRVYRDGDTRKLLGFNAGEYMTRSLSIPTIYAGLEDGSRVSGLISYDPAEEFSQDFVPRYKLSLDVKTERPLSDYGLKAKRIVRVCGLAYEDGVIKVDFVTTKDHCEHLRFPIDAGKLKYASVDEDNLEPSVICIVKNDRMGKTENEEACETWEPLRVAIHDSEKEHFKKLKTFPNLVLMKISTYHKEQGDSVEWWKPDKSYDLVYSSKVFDFTKENPLLPPDTIKGGTGYGEFGELPAHIDSLYPDYSMYPECDYAIGYLTRGCSNNCPWCYVPKKEGGIKEYGTWRELVRKDTDKLVLMDNNILACEHGLRQLADLSENGKHVRVDFNQGLDARLVTEEIADMLAGINWIRFIRFSCDSKSQLTAIDRVVEMLQKRGIRPYNVFVYLLVRKDLTEADYRVQWLKKHKGINLYAQAERNEPLGIVPDRAQLEFTRRYMYSGTYKKETWEEYLSNRPWVVERLRKAQGSVLGCA